MPRPLRPDPPGAWYHVINRGADRQDIFSCDADRLYFESLLADSTSTHGVEVHAYALMTTHYHVLLHCPDGGLSAAMKDLQSVYVGTYNFQHDRTGPMFEGRFKSVPVDSPSARHLTGRYIHRNPLDIVPAGALAAYRWSSLGVYTRARAAPGWLHTDELAAQFGDARAYFDYVIARHPSDRQADRAGSASGSGSVIDLDRAVASICGVPVESLRVPHTWNSARLLAITLAVELRLMRSADLADHYRLSSAASLRATARRGRVRLADDPVFAALRAAILGRGRQNITKGA